MVKGRSQEKGVAECLEEFRVGSISLGKSITAPTLSNPLQESSAPYLSL